MDFDKLIAIVKSLGFPAAIAIWFLWVIQAFFTTIIAQNAVVIELLRHLIELHR